MVITTLGLTNKNPASSPGPKKSHDKMRLHEVRVCNNVRKEHKIVVINLDSESSLIFINLSLCI